MGRTSVWRSAALAALVALGGCTETLTTPGHCPELCASNGVQMADTLLVAADSADTTARGYVLADSASYVVASTLDALKGVVLYRFSRLDTSWAQTSADTVQAVFPPDSVQFVLQITSRDTTMHQRLVFYRLPARFDSAMTYAQALAYFGDSVLLDTAAVPDTGLMTVRLPTSLFPAPADSGVVAIGIKLLADSATAIGLASGFGGSTAPALAFYVHGQPPQDTLAKNLTVAPTFAASALSPAPGALPPGLRAIGGIPSAHTLIHLTLPKFAVDSVSIVRASLLLTVSPAVLGFPNDSFTVVAYPLLRDYGPKSVLFTDTTLSGHTVVHAGQGGVVDVDITAILRLWGATVGDSLPHAIMLYRLSEAATLGELDFLGKAAGAGGPQLRVTYVTKYELGVP